MLKTFYKTMLRTQCFKAFLAIIWTHIGIIVFKDLGQYCHELCQKHFIKLDSKPSLKKSLLAVIYTDIGIILVKHRHK
jgi:hypothetical protein